MLYAAKKNLEVDTFVIYTDSETWAGSVHPYQALKQYRASTAPVSSTPRRGSCWDDGHGVLHRRILARIPVCSMWSVYHGRSVVDQPVLARPVKRRRWDNRACAIVTLKCCWLGRTQTALILYFWKDLSCMISDTYNKHINAGLLAGKDSTCKVHHVTNTKSWRASEKFYDKWTPSQPSKKGNRGISLLSVMVGMLDEFIKDDVKVDLESVGPNVIVYLKVTSVRNLICRWWKLAQSPNWQRHLLQQHNRHLSSIIIFLERNTHIIHQDRSPLSSASQLTRRGSNRRSSTSVVDPRTLSQAVLILNESRLGSPGFAAETSSELHGIRFGTATDHRHDQKQSARQKKESAQLRCCQYDGWSAEAEQDVLLLQSERSSRVIFKLGRMWSVTDSDLRLQVESCH